MSRLRMLLVGCLVFLLTACQKKSVERPNILFILADDWSYPFASIYGDPLVQTPNLDWLAAHGMVFEQAYCAAPSCTPSRASILTGQYPHRLGEGVNLCGKLDVSVPTYVQLLRKAGYAVGFDRKGWAPGDFTKMGYTENPCGENAELGAFVDKTPTDQPFFFWFGTHDPHRPFETGSGQKAGIDPASIKIPDFLPDTPEIRADLADYYGEILRFDAEVAQLLKQLKDRNRLKNTIVVVTSDNGMPFPHAKANLYDYGTHVPLMISSFKGQLVQNLRHDSFVNLIDLTPTFLDLAGVTDRPRMDGKSLLPILKSQQDTHRTEVFLERERHCLCRAEFDYGAGYPMRAVRNKDYLYIQNLRPDRYPAGDERISNTPSEYGDVDGGPTKVYMMDHRNEPKVRRLFDLGFGKRPAEELYDVRKDPYQLINLAGKPEHAAVQAQLRSQLLNWMIAEQDPRLNGSGDQIDRYRATTRAWITKTDIILLDGQAPLKP
jgi:N-sulfoglucosamine sulfohydrolase